MVQTKTAKIQFIEDLTKLRPIAYLRWRLMIQERIEKMARGGRSCLPVEESLSANSAYAPP